MKKNIFAILMVLILSLPIVILGIISALQEKSTPIQKIIKPTELVEEEETLVPIELPTSAKPKAPAIPSQAFTNGYLDGKKGKRTAPIRWAMSEDYRQGYNLGEYDRIHKIERYENKK